MTVVSGILQDNAGNALANAQVTLRYLQPLVGLPNGNMAAQVLLVLTTDGSGELTTPDLIVGRWEVAVSAPPSNLSPAPVELKFASATAAGDTMSWGTFLKPQSEPVTPSLVQQALDAAARAERALAIARVIPVMSSRNLADTDAGALLQVTAAATLTIPTDATAGWSDNLVISILRDGAGACAIQAASGVTLSGVLAGGTTIADQYQFAQIVRMGANSWRVTGWVTEVAA
jgi:hypothetical protein